ncbi:MAG: FHA domain-containing protein, partial [Planctomycetota bacterium]
MTLGWSLWVERGYNRGTRYLLPAGELIVGRDPTAQVRIDADGVSRRHARLVPGERGLELVDLESTNGVAVNGVPCASTLLQDGDRVRFGDVECRVQAESGGERRASTIVLQPSDLPEEVPAAQVVVPHVDLVGTSAPLKRLLGQVERVAQADCAVLLRGETGTGKELFARAIHALSPRRRRGFVAVNCATLDGELL